MIVAGIYMITRMRKTDMFSMLRNRKICRGGTKGWFGWRREKIESLSDAPPRYSSENMPQQGNTGFASDEKSIPQQLSGFFSPIVKADTPTSRGQFVPTKHAEPKSASRNTS
jgi:hypothetical protein